MTAPKPEVLAVRFEEIPFVLKKTPRWVLWKHVLVGEGPTAKWAKLPVQVGGRPASSTNPGTWTDFLSAQEAYGRGSYDGVGFVFDGSDRLVGVDLDDCYDSAAGRYTNPDSERIVSSIEGYVEVSPSGTGVKMFTLADLQAAHADHDRGVEVYGRGRYFTVTGHRLGGEVPTEPQELSRFLPARAIQRSGDEFADYSPPLEGWDIARVESELLSKLDPDCGYADWLSVGMALHHQFQGGHEALELWDRWSSNEGACPSWTEGLCAQKWGTFLRKGGATLRSLTFRALQREIKAELESGVKTLKPSSPVQHAREFLDALYRSEEGLKLVHYADDHWLHKGTHYEPVEEATIRSQMYRFMERCKKVVKVKKGDSEERALAPFDPTPAAVSAALDAMRALTHLANHPGTRPPVWLDGYADSRPEASKLISLQNGLFHIGDGLLIPHSLGFFTQNSLPFSYEPQAQCPSWVKLMAEIWPDDPDSVNLLQEYFGYVISGDTRQQKMLNVIGPRRSGKGTINKVLVALLGQHNTVAPQLEELCDTFGLQPWLGKLLASFTDVRVPSKNSGTIVSQLLRIVGGDTVTVNRKNKDSWNGYLPTRLILYSNEALQLSENSNALTGRMLVLRMQNSFFGREDVGLADRLEKELAGIFNWAMEGQKRRVGRDGERFVQPESGRQMLELMEELGNPLMAFMEKVLEFDPAGSVDKDHLFACYRRWALHKNLVPGSDLSFKRRFLAATQDRRVVSAVDRSGGETRHIYRGVKLTPPAQKYILSLDGFNEEVF